MWFIHTPRLDLVPATLALVEADLQSREALGTLLRAAVPASWPPGEYDKSAMAYFRDRLSENPAAAGWYGWYALRREDGASGPTVVGAGGYMGPPGPDGVVEVGYSIVPESRGLGFATELVAALVTHAFTTPGVVRILAHTTPANLGSVRVLERCGFRLVGPGAEPETVQYAVTPPSSTHPPAEPSCLRAHMSTIKTSREIPATPEAVLAAIQDPSRLARWWGPSGFTNTFDTFDFTPGGAWLLTMHGPDGQSYPNESQFLEIVANERVVIRHLNLPHFDLTITLGPSTTGTTVSWLQVFEDTTFAENARDFLLTANAQNMDRLAAEVARM